MGLDMYAYVKYNKESDEADDGHEDIEICYWRKHNALHIYMEKLFNEKYPEIKNTDINCIDVYLDKDDLIELKHQMDSAILLQKSKLENGAGFFFGNTEYMTNGNYAEYYYEEDKKLIEIGLEALDEGHEVFYNANY